MCRNHGGRWSYLRPYFLPLLLLSLMSLDTFDPEKPTTWPPDAEHWFQVSYPIEVIDADVFFPPSKSYYQVLGSVFNREPFANRSLQGVLNWYLHICSYTVLLTLMVFNSNFMGNYGSPNKVARILPKPRCRLPIKTRKEHVATPNQPKVTYQLKILSTAVCFVHGPQLWLLVFPMQSFVWNRIEDM